MKFTKGETVFLASHNRKVIQVTVAKNYKGDEIQDAKSSVLVFHSGYGHEVYVCPKDLYFSKENAQKRVNLDKSLIAIRVSDLATKLTDEVLSK